MKRVLLFLSLLVIGFTTSYGQSTSDSITIKRTFGGYQFYQEGNSLTVNQLVDTLESNEQAFSQIKSAKSNYNLAQVIGFAGGFMVGWPVGSAIAGGDPEWMLAGIGAGLIVISIPIMQKFNKQARQAVNTYNGGLQANSVRPATQLKFCVTGNGFGLALRF